MEIADGAPFVIGVTGHRYIAKEDIPVLKRQIRERLAEITDGEADRAVMLNGLAQGADMLCAEAAFELGIAVYAVLPCEKERYIESFDDPEAKNALFGYIKKSKRAFVAPDFEKRGDWLKEHAGVDKNSYEYRQAGIFIAAHSDYLIALWDGKPPKTAYGCGAAEVVQFALEPEKYVLAPCGNKRAVLVWLECRRG